MALSDLGFSPLAERAYRMLLDRPQAQPVELISALDCTESELHDAVESLVELGAVKPAQDAPAKVAVNHPAAALGKLVEQREDELMLRHRQVGDTRIEIAEFAARYAGDPRLDAASGLERLEDLGQVRERLEELAFFTRSSLYSVQPGGTISAAALDASRPLDLRGLRRGIDMRTIYQSGFIQDRLGAEYAQQMVRAGAKIHVTEEPLERMIIMDQRVAVVPIDPDNSRRGALIVTQPGLIAGFIRLFLRLWDDATEISFDEPPASECDVINEQDRAVLELLAAGNTDESAARAVGMSVRHLRRRVARLMERLNATSRFEAGAQAARRGWL